MTLAITATSPTLRPCALDGAFATCDENRLQNRLKPYLDKECDKPSDLQVPSSRFL